MASPLWEPDAKNRLVQRQLAEMAGAQSSEPGALGPGVYPQPNVGSGGGIDYAAYNRSLPTKSTEQAVGEVVQGAKAEGRDTPNVVELLKLAAMVPGAMVEGAVNAAISGVTLPGDVASGKTQVMDPATGKPTEEVMGRALDLTGVVSSGSFAGAPTGALGSGPVRLYHGSPSTFEKFDIKRSGSGPLTGDVDPMYGPGVSLTTDPKAAHDYAIGGGTPNAQGFVHSVEISPPDNGVIDLGVPIDQQPPNAQQFFKHIKAQGNNADDAFQQFIADKAYNDDMEPRPGFYNAMKKHGIVGVKDPAGEYTMYDPAFLNIKESKPVAADASGKLIAPADFQANAGSKEATMLADAASPELYSHAARVVDALPTKKATANQWIATLKNKGVKDEELEALNIPAGDQVLTKDQIKTSIDVNTPQLKEVVKGGNTGHPQYAQADIDRMETEARRTGNWRPFEEAQAEYEAQQLGRGTAQREWTQEDSARLDDLERRRTDLTDVEETEFQRLVARENAVSGPNGEPPTVTKYSQYQLPGGKNYREILVTTPTRSEFKPVQLPDGSGHWGLQNDKGEWAKHHDNGGVSWWYTQGEAQGSVPWFNREKAGQYQSSHWDEPNVLAHTRVNDRTIDGAKTLHVEELQSDWHQQGKKRGYNTAAASEIDTIAGKVKPGVKPQDVEYGDIMDAQAAGRITDQEANNLTIWQEDFTGRETGQSANAVPDAPFKKSWPDLMLKKIARRAVDEGYDAISWTDGATQADRYDLSKQIESLSYQPVVDQNGKGYMVRIVDKRGNDTYLSPDRGYTPIPEAELEKYVGKEVADKIIKKQGEPDKTGQGRTLSGLDLKVGGEGMKAFYDQELPRRAKKLLGAPVEKKSLSPISVTRETPDSQTWVVNHGTMGDQLVFSNKEAAEAAAEAMRKDEDVAFAGVHFVRLTPEVKARIKKGFPLYSSGLPVGADDQAGGQPAVDRTHDVPAFAGSSDDASTVYIDRHVPKTFNIKGKDVDVAKYMVIHETLEHKLMVDDGLEYDAAHQQATAAERKAVEADGIDWKAYEAHIDGMLHTIENEDMKDPPPDLYTKVYHTPEWGKQGEEIDRAVHRRHMDARKGTRFVRVDHDPFNNGSYEQ